MKEFILVTRSRHMRRLALWKVRCSDDGRYSVYLYWDGSGTYHYKFKVLAEEFPHRMLVELADLFLFVENEVPI